MEAATATPRGATAAPPAGRAAGPTNDRIFGATPRVDGRSRGRSSPPPLERGEQAAATSLLALVQELLRELPGLISDRVELLSLELGRAGAALGKIAALTVAVAILGITAWAMFWTGVVMGLLALDWHPALALGLVILVNAGAAAWALMKMKSLASLLRLPATRRHLTLRDSARAVAASSLPVAATADLPNEEDLAHARADDEHR